MPDSDHLRPARLPTGIHELHRDRAGDGTNDCFDHHHDDLYHDDVHGKPDWRKHMTLRLAEEIRTELAGAGPP